MEEKKQEVIVNYPYYVSIRFKGTKKAYFFGLKEKIVEYGDFAVMETIRGLELGEVISDVRETSTIKLNNPLKPILRKATRKDLDDHEYNKTLSKDALKTCTAAVEKLKLDMNLISAEYTLDRSKVIFIYVADDRVDFRELLKELASVLKCRIELRQIGPRDKAKIVGGLGVCGMETCCSRFLDGFDVVSINMAKNQMLALNIQKLSGQCGKLMCCLKYEDEVYKELRTGIPKMNTQIKYNGKMYRLSSVNVITQQAKIENKEEVLFLPIKEALKEFNKGESTPTEKK